MALETRVWEALRTGNAELDAALLADHFLGVYPSGFATRQEHCGQLSEGPTVATYELRTPRLTVMRDDLVLFSYLAVWSRLQDGQPQASEKMYVSSIWQRIGDDWLNTFSQDTPAS